jgi:hypothetical protein
MKTLLTAILIFILQITYAQKDSIEQQKFRELNCGLFKNDKGDIGFKTTFLIDDMGSRGIRFQTICYLIDDNDTTEGGIIEFKNIIDTSSFEILNDYYCKDKNYVYAIFYTSSGATFNISKKMDSKSFLTFSKSSYGLDKQHIYFRADVVKMANRKTFKSIDDDPNGAYDKNNYYHYGEIISLKEAIDRGYDKNKK